MYMITLILKRKKEEEQELENIGKIESQSDEMKRIL